jgi:hypothetical protein
MPAPQRFRCDEEAGPTVAWENAADGGEQSAVAGFQLGPGGLPLEDGELMAQHQDLQVLGGGTSSEQREELEGAAEREVEEPGQHAGSLRGGLGELAHDTGTSIRTRSSHAMPQFPHPTGAGPLRHPRHRGRRVRRRRPEETASFLLDGLHGLLLRSLHANRSRHQFVTAAWSLCARLLGTAS